jgi:predicted ATPase
MNQVARLLAVGYGGQVLISTATAELVRDRLPTGVVLRDLGEQQFKGLVQRVRVFQAVAPGLPDKFPPLQSIDALPHNLPVPLTSFIGRERELAEVRRRLGSTRLLTLVGDGGTGKTRLAAELGGQVLKDYEHGVWWIDLSSLADSSMVVQAAATGLHLREQPGRALLTTLQDHLQRKQMLLVIDNCEHVIEACSALLDALLRGCPYLRILATSRQVLGVTGETTWRVPSLSFPELRPAPTSTGLEHYDAVRLFVDRAVASRPDFVITVSNGPAVAQICRQLDGIPLALELAAGRINVLTVQQISARLDNRFRLLDGGARAGTPRHQTLRATVDWSYELLSAPEQLVFMRLSVFAGGANLEAVEAICAGQEVETHDVLDLLSRLVDKSLVSVEDHGDEARYRLLETLRQYGQQQLAARDEESVTRRQHADFYLALAVEMESRLDEPERRASIDRLDREHDNLRAALYWYRDTGAPEQELRLSAALSSFWLMRGFWDDADHWLTDALSHATGVEIADRAKVLYGAGRLAEARLQLDQATRRYEDSVELWKEVGDRAGMARALACLGSVLAVQGRVVEARALLEDSLDLFRELRDNRGIATALHELGRPLRRAGQVVAARALFDQSLVLWRTVDDKLGGAATLRALAAISRDEGDYGRARRLTEEALSLAREVGDKPGIADHLWELSLLALLAGDRDRGAALATDCLVIARDLKDHAAVASALHVLAKATQTRGDFDRAADCIGKLLHRSWKSAPPGFWRSSWMPWPRWRANKLAGKRPPDCMALPTRCLMSFRTRSSAGRTSSRSARTLWPRRKRGWEKSRLPRLATRGAACRLNKPLHTPSARMKARDDTARVDSREDCFRVI